MIKDDCIFCKLANGVFETNTVYEDEEFRVILDAAPATRGHALILPKNHYANIYEIDENVAASAMKLAKKLIVDFTDKLGCDGYNVVQNNGEAAGQSVFHLHLHVIPRRKGDQAVGLWRPGKAAPEEMEETAKALCGALAGEE